MIRILLEYRDINGLNRLAEAHVENLDYESKIGMNVGFGPYFAYRADILFISEEQLLLRANPNETAQGLFWAKEELKKLGYNTII